MSTRERALLGGIAATLLIWASGGSLLGHARSGSAPGNAPVQVVVALSVGGAAYTASGGGECIFSDQSSIYEAEGTQWAARHNDDGRNLNMTLWQLKTGPHMMMLSVSVGGKSHHVSTVKVGARGTVQGSGRITAARQGLGGVLTVDAIADTGVKVTGRVTCSKFTAPEDNGR